MLASTPTLRELEEVLARRRFDRFLTPGERQQFLVQYQDAVSLCDVVHSITECQDPKDDKFLELALSGNADVIVTGDQDLLCLHRWRGIAILSPADFLVRVQA